MKRIHLFFMLALAALGMQSCNNDKTYAEKKEEEADAINKYLLENDIKVIDENTFFSQDTMTLADNEYVLFKESGVYMNVMQRGVGSPLTDGTYYIESRFEEMALQTRNDDIQMEAGDTLTANMHINNPTYWGYPEEFKLTVSGTSYSGTFSGVSQMYDTYEQTSVPTGWLLPLQYLKPSRTNSSEDVARVRLLVPHSAGTVTASRYVYPCYYEITYNLGR